MTSKGTVTRRDNKYTRYLRSEAWRVVRAGALAREGYQCASCKRSNTDVALQVHHKTYEHLGHELPSELQVLCVDCHPHVDEERRTNGPIKRHMAKARAFAESRIGTAVWDYDESGGIDGITPEGMDLYDEYLRAHPLRRVAP